MLWSCPCMVRLVYTCVLSMMFVTSQELVVTSTSSRSDNTIRACHAVLPSCMRTVCVLIMYCGQMVARQGHYWETVSNNTYSPLQCPLLFPLGHFKLCICGGHVHTKALCPIRTHYHYPAPHPNLVVWAPGDSRDMHFDDMVMWSFYLQHIIELWPDLPYMKGVVPSYGLARANSLPTI